MYGSEECAQQLKAASINSFQLLSDGLFEGSDQNKMKMKSRVSQYFLRSDGFFEKFISGSREKCDFEWSVGMTTVGDFARSKPSHLCHDFVPFFEFVDNGCDSKEFLSGIESFHRDHPMATRFSSSHVTQAHRL
jgi:hypothetical protein